MTSSISDRRRGQTGASLIMVLAAMAILALLVPALLTLTGTGLLITKPVVQDRVATYAATSALDAAVANGRVDLDIGSAGAPCPTRNTTINGLEATIDCENPPLPQDGCHTVDRFVTFTTQIRRPGNSEVLATASNEVVYRFNPGGAPLTEIRQYSTDASSPVTPMPIPSCRDDVVVPPSTTTTVPPSTTTSTTLPPATTTTTTAPPTTTTTPVSTVLVVSDFTGDAAYASTKNTKDWKAIGTVYVTGGNGQPNTSVNVKIGVETMSKDSSDSKSPTWLAQTQIITTTDANGEAVFETNSYSNKNNKNRIERVRLTITEVTKSGHDWTGGDPDHLVLTIEHPES